ncbi:Transglycosylase SLT domain-containing protein [Caulobacter sp. UNC279MFTsu5.1]|nr:Transglycosylase SLT domain-containing protein [Caulobacter sp. UNC279MFTsu5.1]
MRKFCVAPTIACLILTISSQALAYECETEDGLKFSSPQALNEKFSLALADCRAETQPTAASEQLRLYDAPVTATAVISAGRITGTPIVVASRGLAGTALYAAQTAAAARDYDIDPDLLRAVMHVESRGDAAAVSPKGARGLMQIMPATARRFGVREPLVELSDPMVNIRTGAAYLKTLQRRFGNNLELVLAAYNAGEGAVIKYGLKTPPYRETQGYVTSVMGQYRTFVSARGAQ